MTMPVARQARHGHESKSVAVPASVYTYSHIN